MAIEISQGAADQATRARLTQLRLQRLDERNQDLRLDFGLLDD
jgi:hypothetical protein